MKPPKHLPSGLTGSIIKEPLFGTCFCCDEFEQLMFRLSMASDEADMMGLDLLSPSICSKCIMSHVKRLKEEREQDK